MANYIMTKNAEQINSVVNNPKIGMNIITVGDSQMAANYAITAGGGSTADPIHANQVGFLNWVQALCGFPLSFRFENIGGEGYGDAFAVAGDDYRNVMTRIDDAINRGGDVLYIHFGTNDITGLTAAGFSQSQIQSQIIHAWRACIEKARDAGMTVWIDTIYPRNNDDAADFTATQDLIRIACNTELKSWENAEYKGLLTVFDADTVLLNTATGKLYSAMATDGVHLNSYGAYMVATAFMDKFDLTAQTIGINFPVDYHATNAPYGNLITNSTYSGVAGTVSAGFTGTAPDSWTASFTDRTAVTGVVSVESKTDWNGDAANFVKFALTANGAGADNETPRIAPSATITTGVAIGQWYQVEVEVIVDAVLSGANILRSIYAELRDNGTSGQISRMFNIGYTDVAVKDYFPDGSFRLLLRTFPIFCKTTSGMILRINADVDGTLTGARTIYFGRPVVRPLSFVKQKRGLYVQESIPTAGSTVQVRDGRDVAVLLNPAGVLATLTVTLPVAPMNGDTVTISTSQTITALTVTGTTTSSPTTLAVTAGVKFIYSTTSSKWFRV